MSGASVRFAEGRLEVTTPYRPLIVEQIRAIPSRRWHAARKVNTIALDDAPALAALVARHSYLGWQIEPAARMAMSAGTERPAEGFRAALVSHGDCVTVVLSEALRRDADALNALAAVPGSEWHTSRGTVAIELDGDSAPALVEWLIANRPIEADIDLKRRIIAIAEDGRSLQREHEALAELSRAPDAELEIDGLGGGLLPFQRAGVAYVLRADGRAMIADEPGLGKTVQALAVLHARDAFPALVVCPATMRLTWRAHVEGPVAGAPNGWLPGRSALLLDGPARARLRYPDVMIISFDSLHKWSRVLVDAECLRGLVLDESHRIKSLRARRTKAALLVGAAVRETRLCLSGTPIINRPEEIDAQLRLLGRDGEIRRAVGASRDLTVLHEQMRRRCFVRRTKDQVLSELPAKRLADVPVQLDNEAEYQRVKDDVIAWLREQVARDAEFRASIAHLDAAAKEAAIVEHQDAAAERAERARRLVELNKLRLVCARGKVTQAIRWASDFLASGEQLVVFACHREVQRALCAGLSGSVAILGDSSAQERESARAAFQAGEAPVIVCSIKAAGEGLTLTAASNVLFTELDWTPAAHTQAEDRCHRIGQRDAVTAWYLLAEGTIDSDMRDLLEAKRKVVDAATDGVAVGGTDSIAEALALRLIAADDPCERSTTHKLQAQRLADAGRPGGERGSSVLLPVAKDDQACAPRPAALAPGANSRNHDERKEAS